MATVVAPNNILKVLPVCFTANQVSMSPFHFLVAATAPPAPTDLECAVFFDGTFSPLYQALLSTAANYRGTSCQIIFPLPVRVAQASVAGLVAGTVGGNPLPTQTSGIVKFRTVSAGRAFRGRTFVPFPGGNANGVSGLPTNIYVGNLNALLAAIVPGPLVVVSGGGGTATLKLVIYHRKLHTNDVVTDGASEQKWATTRRRGSFGRPNSLPF